MTRAADPKRLLEGAIIFEVAGGEPGAPEEKLSLTLQGEEASLMAVISGPGPGRVRQERVAIAADSFWGLWQVIEEQRLRGWLPEQEPEVAFDYGERRLRIEWRVPSIAKMQIHDVAWSGPIHADEGFQKLKKAAIELAQRHLKEVRPSFVPQLIP